MSAIEVSPSHDPAEHWAALAPRLAARGRMRVSRDGGRNYPRRGERRVSADVPNQPAAVLVYDDNGCAPVLCLDLDTSKGGQEAVDRDFLSLSGLLNRVGAAWFSDSSPNAGRHIYVPLAAPLPYAEARAAVLAFAARTPTLDPLPMLGLTEGCIRPPGARHRTGGHQGLQEPLAVALAALNAPTTPEVWHRLVSELPTVPTSPGSGTQTADDTTVVVQLDRLRGFTEPDADFQRIARTGEYPDRYASPSEARQAVVWSAVACGWAFPDLIRRLEDGTWPGLASFYARYSPAHRHTAITRDWHAAVRHEKRRRAKAGNSSVRVCTTSPRKSQRGAHSRTTTNQRVREWLAAVDLLLGPEQDLAHRIVLYALAEAAVLTDSLTVEHGNRSLAIATGLDQSTVGRVLRRLVDEPSDRCLIDLVRPARGVQANLYSLQIPALLEAACAAKPWRRGRVHALRPVFRDLGLPAAFVYAALERLGEPAGGRDLAALARIGPTATYEALATLAAWGLAERVDGGWIRGRAELRQLAEAWGLADAIRDQVERYRAERRTWW
ncbi:MAG: MarR family transcriptional regulator, partial [Brachybacterium sp.]|nr:MarR family transcriptional regulator [Brachybacterium sp.]